MTAKKQRSNTNLIGRFVQPTQLERVRERCPDVPIARLALSGPSEVVALSREAGALYLDVATDSGIVCVRATEVVLAESETSNDVPDIDEPFETPAKPTPEYTCELSVGEWQLYSYDDDGESKRRARVKRRAASLSKRLTKLVRAELASLGNSESWDVSTRKRIAAAIRVRDKMYKLMSKYADDGARDTEPEGVLVSVLEIAFDLDSYSLER